MRNLLAPRHCIRHQLSYTLVRPDLRPTDIFYVIHPIDRKFNDFTPTIHAAEILFLKPLIDTLLIAAVVC